MSLFVCGSLGEVVDRLLDLGEAHPLGVPQHRHDQAAVAADGDADVEVVVVDDLVAVDLGVDLGALLERVDRRLDEERHEAELDAVRFFGTIRLCSPRSSITADHVDFVERRQQRGVLLALRPAAARCGGGSGSSARLLRVPIAGADLERLARSWRASTRDWPAAAAIGAGRLAGSTSSSRFDLARPERRLRAAQASAVRLSGARASAERPSAARRRFRGRLRSGWLRGACFRGLRCRSRRRRPRRGSRSLRRLRPSRPLASESCEITPALGRRDVERRLLRFELDEVLVDGDASPSPLCHWPMKISVTDSPITGTFNSMGMIQFSDEMSGRGDQARPRWISGVLENGPGAKRLARRPTDAKPAAPVPRVGVLFTQQGAVDQLGLFALVGRLRAGGRARPRRGG